MGLERTRVGLDATRMHLAREMGLKVSFKHRGNVPDSRVERQKVERRNKRNVKSFW